MGTGGFRLWAAFPPKRAAYCSFRQATRGELTAVPREDQLQPLQTRTDVAGARRSTFPPDLMTNCQYDRTLNLREAQLNRI